MSKKIISIIKNKYIIISIFFIVWIIFFDQNNLIHQRRLREELKNVKKEHKFYLNEIEKDTKKYLEINNNIERLEKLAREKYLMKKNNEDIYLVVYE